MNSQKGVALPIALIMFVAMLIGGIYLARNSASGSLVVSNLAYQRLLSRHADQGLLRGQQWLATTWQANKVGLDSDIPAQGYVSAALPLLGANPATTGDAAFWAGGVTLSNYDGQGNDLQYVIHRLCQFTGPFSANTQRCVTTSIDATPTGGASPGMSLDAGAGEVIEGLPMIHYLISARPVNTRKGTTSTNQLVVMMGA